MIKKKPREPFPKEGDPKAEHVPSPQGLVVGAEECGDIVLFLRHPVQPAHGYGAEAGIIVRKEVGDILESALAMVLKDQSMNDRELLLQYARYQHEKTASALRRDPLSAPD